MWNRYGKEEKDMNIKEIIFYTIGLSAGAVAFLLSIIALVWLCTWVIIGLWEIL
jgi:hypothetical protein